MQCVSFTKPPNLSGDTQGVLHPSKSRPNANVEMGMRITPEKKVLRPSQFSTKPQG